MKFTIYFYYFLVSIIILNANNITLDSPHIFSLIIINISIAIILVKKIHDSETDYSFKLKYLLLGFACAYFFYYLEGYILN
ncbi:hypothetical protein KZO01_26230 [Kurthia zopfii]|uniref:Uncharacterized protein n=1 Tax=Kurthia zopfii TaxID=1650 RepID=A0A8B4QA99_9BACL|nr:hypothetical protein DFR61_1629 [Kurthia zopfii]GEK32314.1 hypothetical protein KZO01_26230 [Kurthia zopfii]STX09653.1 Uncharacterised protein [Kurthia zopfii]